MNSFEQLGQFGNVLSGFSNFATQGFGYPMKHEIITVSSYQEAKDFKLNKGDTYDLLDPNADILYIKECDNLGRVSLKAFKLTDVSEQLEEQTTPANITRQEYNTLMGKIDNLLNNMESGGKNAVKKSTEQPELNFTNK